ncbi:hypothetical protein MRX96_024857 [Rhipicephalus microplus]
MGMTPGQFSLVGKCASSPINAGVNRLWAEGHDGNSTMRSANPLLYFMQMFVAFLLPVGHNAPICAGHGIFNAAFQRDQSAHVTDDSEHLPVGLHLGAARIGDNHAWA